MFKKIISAGCALALLALAGCAESEPNAGGNPSGKPTSQVSQGVKLEKLNAITPTTMAFGAPMAGFGSHGPLKALVKSTSVSHWDGVEQLKSSLLTGKAELAATPAYVAANLYNKGVDVRLVGPVVWGMLFVLGPKTATEGNWEAMRGQKVAIPLPNNMPDLVFSYLLSKNKLTKKDIKPVYAETGQQALALLMKGEVDWVVLPEHAATLALVKAAQSGKQLKRVLDLQAEWGKVTGKPGRFPMAGLVMPGKIVDQHPELVAAVIAEVKAGVAKANSGDPATIKQIAEQYKLPAKVVKQVIPRLQLDMVPAKQARAEYEDFLTRLGEISPKIYGGKLPAAGFYAG